MGENMFTDKAKAVIDIAKAYAIYHKEATLTLEALVRGMQNHTEGRILLAECINRDPEQLSVDLPDVPKRKHLHKLPLSKSVYDVMMRAQELAEETPGPTHPGMVDLRHLVCAVAMSDAPKRFLEAKPLSQEDAIALLCVLTQRDSRTLSLSELTQRLRDLRKELLARVYGQDHAIHAFVEGFFNAEVVADADDQRKGPQAIFVFAGPPGVGKTYLAELGASYLDRPFMRFDMTAFSGHHQHQTLIGMPKHFMGAHPGVLTGFVDKNPNAVLLFDEIEKASEDTIQLFLQVLDAGRLGDKFLERDIVFRDTNIIFTTNAGKALYDKPNMSGVHKANSAFHRKTILDALETEIDPRTRQPFFPASICSRLATGYPVLFNHLKVNELERVVESELNRQTGLFQQQYYKQVTFDAALPMCLILREGARTDARTCRSQAEIFVKTEIFKLCQLFKTERLEEVLSQIDRIHLTLDQTIQDMDAHIRMLFELMDKPKVLLVADPKITLLYEQSVDQIHWRTANHAEDALQILANEDVDMVLVDLWLNRPVDPGVTIQHFDHVPLAAKGLAHGQELLRRVRERLPDIPVYLLSICATKKKDGDEDEGTIDEGLFMACVRAGGARGMIKSSFINRMVAQWEQHRDRFAQEMLDICHRLQREKTVTKLGQEHKVLGFDTVPHLDEVGRKVEITLRNLRLTRALAAADASEVLDEVERPPTRFDDVIGAESAKEELQFFIDYLKNPRRFAALGVKPPKGVLLHGPPGTGKTMLARAMAGESDVAFVPCVGSNLQSKYVGSGAENVRNLFARASRYAPAIIFIDEIDAIGKARTGDFTDSTLNALLTEMDGFTSPSPDRPVFVLAATNFDIDDYGSEDDDPTGRRVLDPALVRRFSRTIHVDIPDRAARLQYLNKRLKERHQCTITDETIHQIVDRSAGMTIANLELIIETATRRAAEADTELTSELLLEALESHPMPDDIERPTTKFDDVIGANAAKEELQFFTDFLKDPSQLANLGFKHPKGVLLYGPPGTGKTMLARAMAAESNVAFIPTTGTTFVTMWHGSGPQNIRKLFARARRRAPAIVFIDEIDAIGKVRTGTPGAGQAEERTLNALLTEIDGFTSPSPDKPVFVLAATNFDVKEDDSEDQESYKKLDPALLSRFSRKIEVELPDRSARLRFLEMRLKARPVHSVTDESIRLVAERSLKMNFRVLESVLETAARDAIRSGQKLNDHFLEEALETIQYGERKPWKPEQVKKVARHEAGHTIMYWLSGWWANYVSVVSRGKHGGYMAPCSEQIEQRYLRIRDDILADIRVSLGGRAAEVVYYGEKEGLSVGPSSDLKNATNIARRMVSQYGMDDTYGILSTPELFQYREYFSSPVFLKINEAANRILKEQMEITIKQVREHRPYIDKLVDALVEKERLTTEDLKTILPPIGTNKGKKP